MTSSTPWRWLSSHWRAWAQPFGPVLFFELVRAGRRGRFILIRCVYALILLTGLPVVSLVQLLGGVDPTLVLVGFAATGLTMLSLAALSILNSVFAQKPRDAIVLTYLAVVAYMALSLLGLVPLHLLRAAAT